MSDSNRCDWNARLRRIHNNPMAAEVSPRILPSCTPGVFRSYSSKDVSVMNSLSLSLLLPLLLQLWSDDEDDKVDEYRTKTASALRRLFSKSFATRHNADPPTRINSKCARHARSSIVASISGRPPGQFVANARANDRTTSSRRLDWSSSLLDVTRGNVAAKCRDRGEKDDEAEEEEDVSVVGDNRGSSSE